MLLIKKNEREKYNEYISSIHYCVLSHGLHTFSFVLSESSVGRGAAEFIDDLLVSSVKCFLASAWPFFDLLYIFVFSKIFYLILIIE